MCGFLSDDMGVSENNGTPKSSILIGFSIINHPFWGTSIFGNTHMEDASDKDGHGEVVRMSIPSPLCVEVFFIPRRDATKWRCSRPLVERVANTPWRTGAAKCVEIWEEMEEIGVEWLFFWGGWHVCELKCWSNIVMEDDMLVFIDVILHV